MYYIYKNMYIICIYIYIYIYIYVVGKIKCIKEISIS